MKLLHTSFILAYSSIRDKPTIGPTAHAQRAEEHGTQNITKLTMSTQIITITKQEQQNLQ